MDKTGRSLFSFVCWLSLFAYGAHAQLDSREKTGQPGTEAWEVDEVSAQIEESLLAHLRQHHQPAVAFVVDQFDKHDIVLLGEDHQVADNCRFVSSLIEPLYHKGVRTLAWEFTRSRFNDKIARLVTATEFDHELANQLLRRGPWPTWGYQEYVDILQSAWKLNRSHTPKLQRLNHFAAQLIITDRTYQVCFNGGLPKLSNAARKVGWGTAKSRSVREDVPENLANRHHLIGHSRNSHLSGLNGGSSCS